MAGQSHYERYQELQRYVGWSEDDGIRLQSIGPLLDDALPKMINDFYDEVERHPDARKVITGGAEQIKRLKGTLINWLRELLAGQYDAPYVDRRWKVGYRHVEIGLDQVYTNVALSRLRTGLIMSLEDRWRGDKPVLAETIRSLNKLLDLDLAIIEDAYQSEYMARREAAERLAAIGQVSGGIAHELRNPLNVIKTSVYYLLNAKNASPAKTSEHLNRVAKQVGLADGVITALSNFAKLPLPILKPFTLAECLAEVVETTLLPESIQVSIECPQPLPAAMADVDQMRIVFSNLIRNARDAMPGGGRLTISANQDDNHIVVAVTDTGHGMDPLTMSRIMEPLFTTKARGIGLGLAMARSIVEKNNGTLQAASELNLGSTFTVRLQAESGEASAATGS